MPWQHETPALLSAEPSGSADGARAAAAGAYEQRRADREPNVAGAFGVRLTLRLHRSRSRSTASPKPRLRMRCPSMIGHARMCEGAEVCRYRLKLAHIPARTRRPQLASHRREQARRLRRLRGAAGWTGDADPTGGPRFIARAAAHLGRLIGHYSSFALEFQCKVRRSCGSVSRGQPARASRALLFCFAGTSGRRRGSRRCARRAAMCSLSATSTCLAVQLRYSSDCGALWI